MKIEKKVVANLEKCYALAPITYHSQTYYVAASELEEACLLLNADGEVVDRIWDKPGGVMSMVYVPETDGIFFATTKFYGFNHAELAEITMVTPTGGDYVQTKLCDLPFVHRIDILRAGGTNYLVACTLKSGHEYDDDWRFPGKVLVAQMPEDMQMLAGWKPEFEVVAEGLFHNHGYTKAVDGADEYALICADSGVYTLKYNGTWKMDLILDQPVSDAVLLDLDGDGKQELCAIAPFHGDRIQIYHEEEGGYHLVYEHPEKLPFLHAICAMKIADRQIMIAGNRAGKQALYAFSYHKESRKYESEILDQGRGPANVLVMAPEEELLCANRETDELALYRIRQDA